MSVTRDFFAYSKGEAFVSFLPWMPERVPWQASSSQNADSLLTLDGKLETEWGMGSTPQARGACAICTVDRAELSRSEPSLCPGPVPSPPQFLLQWLLSDSIVPCVLPCLLRTLGGHTSRGGCIELGSVKCVICIGSLGLESLAGPGTPVSGPLTLRTPSHVPV